MPTPEFTYQAIVNDVKSAAGDAAFTAAVITERGEVALSLSALFPRAYIRDVRNDDVVEVRFRFFSKEEAEAAQKAAVAEAPVAPPAAPAVDPLINGSPVPTPEAP